jgi:hypothetical protein
VGGRLKGKVNPPINADERRKQEQDPYRWSLPMETVIKLASVPLSFPEAGFGVYRRLSADSKPYSQ